jgi:hypothetical protein
VTFNRQISEKVLANLSINLIAQSCALGSLHACGIPAAGYFQR